VRAGTLGLPLMVAIIGGETHRFRPLVDLYRKAGEKAGHLPEQLKVGLHSLGYVANSTQEALDDYYPGYAETFTRIGKERGWPPVTRGHFDAQMAQGVHCSLVARRKWQRRYAGHSESLGGITRFYFPDG